MILRGLTLSAALVAFIWTPVAAAGPSVSLGDGAVSIPAGQTAPFPIKIAGVQDLYGFEFQLKFDPAVVEVVDADPDTPGIQSLPGNFLSLDLLLRNDADNGAGTIEYVTTQLNPSEAKSGSGTLFTILFKGLSPAASSKVEVVKAQFANRSGVRIEIPVAAGTVRVAAAAGASQSSPTPIPTVREPQVDLTAVALTPQPTRPPQTATPAPPTATAAPLPTATRAIATAQPANATPAPTMTDTLVPTISPGISASPSPGAGVAAPAATGVAPVPTASSIAAVAAATTEPTSAAATATTAPAAVGATDPILPAAQPPDAVRAPRSSGARAGSGFLIGGGVAIVLSVAVLGVFLAQLLRQRDRRKA